MSGPFTRPGSINGIQGSAAPPGTYETGDHSPVFSCVYAQRLIFDLRGIFISGGINTPPTPVSTLRTASRASEYNYPLFLPHGLPVPVPPGVFDIFVSIHFHRLFAWFDFCNFSVIFGVLRLYFCRKSCKSRESRESRETKIRPTKVVSLIVVIVCPLEVLKVVLVPKHQNTHSRPEQRHHNTHSHHSSGSSAYLAAMVAGSIASIC